MSPAPLERRAFPMGYLLNPEKFEKKKKKDLKKSGPTGDAKHRSVLPKCARHFLNVEGRGRRTMQ